MKQLIICIFMMLALGVNNSSAQSVKREGNNFTQVPSKRVKAAKDSTLTKFTYTDRKGKVYPVYLSSTGKAYIRISQKEGAKGRRYMPEIGKQINPQAYKEK
jgi:hypothetical protein